MTGFGQTRIDDLRSGAVLGSLEGDPSEVNGVSDDAQGRWIAAALDRTVGLFELPQGSSACVSRCRTEA